MKWLAVTLTAVSVWFSSCFSGKPVPDLPALDLSHFSGEARETIARAETAAKTASQDAEAALHLAMALHAHEQYKSAGQAYARSYALDAKRFATLYCWSHALASEGDYGTSALRLREALALRPDSIPAQLKLAEVLRESGDAAAGAEICQRVLKNNPGEAQAHYGLGRAQGGDAAAAEFRKALDLFPRYGAAQFALAGAYRRKGETTKADDLLREYERDKTLLPPLEDPEMAAVRALNTSANSLLQRAAEQELEGRLDQAVALYERARSVDPTLVQAHVDLISLYARLHRDQEAEAAYRQAITLNPNLSDAHYNFGVLCFERGRTAEAKAAFETATRLQPRHAEALHNLGVLVEQQGKWGQAAALYQRAVDAKTEYPLAHFHLGRIYANQNKYPLAIQEFERALQPPTEGTPSYLYALAATHARAGDAVRAARLLRDARTQAAARGQQAVVASIDRDLASLEKKP